MRYRTWFIFVVGFVWTMNTYGQEVDRYLPSAWPDHIVLSIEDQESATRTVTWRTDTTKKQQSIQWLVADASSNLEEMAHTFWASSVYDDPEGVAAMFHKYTFEELKAGLVYAYRVGDGDAWSEWFQFKMPQSADTFSFIYLGDAQNDMRDLWSRCIRTAYGFDPDASFILHAGDMVDFSSNNWEWGEWFYGGGWIFASLPQVTVVGNHEYVKKNGEPALNEYWRSSFSLPLNGPKDLQESTYYFDQQHVRFIVLDSRDMLIDDIHARRQADWLKKVLESNDKQWTIVSHHHPVYSARGNRGDYAIKDYLEPIYKQYKVDLVLQGHHHSFARGRHPDEVGADTHEGPVYYVSNSGPKMYDTNFADWMERVATNVQLFHVIDINGNQLEVRTYLTNQELYDHIRLSNQPDGTKYLEEIRVQGVKERLQFSQSSYGADIDQSEESRATFKRKSLLYLEKRDLLKE